MTEQKIIEPTVGRVVHYYAPRGDVDYTYNPQCALIAHVWDDRCVNLAIFDVNGVPYDDPPTSVLLVQPGDLPPRDGGDYCTWMPYQVTKGYGSESGEKAACGQHGSADLPIELREALDFYGKLEEADNQTIERQSEFWLDPNQFRDAVKALGRMSVHEHQENGLTRLEARRVEQFYFEAKDTLERLEE